MPAPTPYVVPSYQPTMYGPYTVPQHRYAAGPYSDSTAGKTILSIAASRRTNHNTTASTTRRPSRDTATQGSASRRRGLPRQRGPCHGCTAAASLGTSSGTAQTLVGTLRLCRLPKVNQVSSTRTLRDVYVHCP